MEAVVAWYPGMCMHTVIPERSSPNSDGGSCGSSPRPGAPHGTVPWNRWVATASAGVGLVSEHAVVAARRWSAKHVSTDSRCHKSTESPGDSASDERVQSDPRV